MTTINAPRTLADDVQAFMNAALLFGPIDPARGWEMTRAAFRAQREHEARSHEVRS